MLKMILNFTQIYADLSITDIQKTVNEVFVNDHSRDLTILKETIANPLFGFFADKSGLNYNIRFFSQYIQIKDKRTFIADKSDDPVTSLAIKLFPSPSGQFTSSTSAFTNPLNLLNGNRKESIQIFANLFISVLKNENNLQFNFNQGKNEIAKNFKMRKNLFNKLKKMLFEEKKDSIFKDKTIKLLLIHSYMINILDPCIQNEEPLHIRAFNMFYSYFNSFFYNIEPEDEEKNIDYFKIYLTEIANSYKSSGDPRFLEIKIDKDVLQLTVDHYKTMNSFPYSLLNKPESNKFIPSYNRREDKFDENTLFSDCAEVTILRLCNCLFFYNGKYTLKHLLNPSDELVNFYTKYNSISSLTVEKRKEWSKVIQDLNEEGVNSSNYPTAEILYNSPTNNEVFPGIINMMNILIRITGLEDENILDGVSKDNLREKLSTLIEKLSIKENNQCVTKLTMKMDTVEEFKIASKGKKDFSGNFVIEFEYFDKTGGTIEVSHYKNLMHSELNLLKTKNKKIINFNKKKIHEKLKNLTLSNILFKSFIFPEDKYLDLDYDNLVIKFYLGGRIDNNNSSYAILNAICRYIDKLEETTSAENIERVKILENLLRLILDKVELNDRGTRSFLKMFLCFKRSALHPEDLNLTVFSYINSFKHNLNFLHRKWEEFFSNEIRELKIFDLSMCVNFVAKEMPIKKQVEDFLISKINNFKNIEELLLYTLNLNEENLGNIIRSLSNPEKVERLDISTNRGIILPKEIENLVSLKYLNCSRCEINSLSDVFAKLKFIEELILYSNDLKNISPEFFENFPNLKIIDLSYTLISDDIIEKLFKIEDLEEINISFTSITELPENIENLTSLKVLNIEHIGISNLPAGFNKLKSLEKLNLNENIMRNLSPEVFKDFKNLKKLSLRETFISYDFLQNLFEIINPVELDISSNELNAIPDNIKNLTNLEILNLYSNEILNLPVGLKDIKSLKRIYLNKKLISKETHSLFKDQLY